MQIKELFNFEDIQQVVAIGNIENEQEMVEKFVISPNLKEDLLEFLEYLKGNKPEKNTSVDVIGNYGTGKSHLLTFLSLILSNPEMVQYIQDEDIKNEFSRLDNEFLVVKYELPGQDISLEKVFLYRVKKQLKENYDVDISSINTDEKDPKELVEEILLKIKEKYPNKGLIVIFDEYSDFLKSKESFKQNRDLQFTRQIAECSKNQDFILMLSMQEYIFSNPEYKDKADLINKIEKRFLKFNITSENIEDIIAKRMVTKTPNQIEELKNQFETIKEKFPNIALEEDRYINLFPVHPYLIEMLSRLTLFENRSILMFISDQTKKIQEKEFPAFITYDLIYDEMIESEHTIKNNEMVKPVIDIVKSLRDIIPRLDAQYQARAKTLIDALAIKNLVTPPDNNGEKKGGDTPEKFAENLCILPNSKFMEPSEDISTILNMLISKSEGQFISRDEKSNTYFINLNRTTDYNQIINNKAANMDDIVHNNEVFVEDFLLNELGFDLTNEIAYSENKYVIEDTVTWNERNSFRNGILAIDIGNKLSIENDGDYLISIKGSSANNTEHDINHIIIKPEYTDEFKWSIRRLAAVNEFLKTKTHVNAMRSKKNTIIDTEVKKYFKEALLNSTIHYRTNDYSLEELGITIDITSEIFSQVKEKLLGEDLVNMYPEYPKFKSDAKLSLNNIEGTIESVLREISQKTILSDFDLKSRRILTPLELYPNDSIDVNNSRYTSIILNQVENTFKNISISDIVEFFEAKPYGMQKEITYLLIAILLRNGNIMISNKNGKQYSSSDFAELFKPGLKVFENLKYIKQEEGPNAEAQKLFDMLDLDKNTLTNKKEYPQALKSYVEKISSIEFKISDINNQFNNIVQNNAINLPIDEIKEKVNFINNTSFEEMEVSSINDFNKLDYSKENLDNIKESIDLIYVLDSFLVDYNKFLYVGITYMENAINFIDNDFFKATDKDELTKIYQESLDIINNTRKLLKEDERRPIEGKIQLFKTKYKNIYYTAHEQFVGKNVNWVLLEQIENSSIYNKLNTLSKVRSINASKFNNLRLEIQTIKGLRCTSFSADELDTNYHCSCMFPKTMGEYGDIDNKINEIDDTISKLYVSWEKEIVSTVSDNKMKLDQLNPDEQDIIDKILLSQQLPENIEFNVVSAINNLLEDIEIKELKLNDLYDSLTSERDTLNVNEILDKLEDYIKQLVSDTDNARIKIIKEDE